MKIDNNTVAIVTGGASGLGEGAARNLMKQGAKVMVADLNTERGQAMEQEFGNQCKFFKTNVTDEENVKQMVDATIQAFGAIHIVINSAGVISAGMFYNSKGKTIETKELMKVLTINVAGTFNVAKHAVVHMSKQEPLNDKEERGVIINVSSVAAFEGQKGQTVYSASKGAIAGMTMPMARDLGKFGIRVVTIAPGIFATPMGSNIPPKIVAGLERSTALGRLGTTDEFAEFVSGACSNSYLTGVILRLDGGVKLPNF